MGKGFHGLLVQGTGQSHRQFHRGAVVPQIQHDSPLDGPRFELGQFVVGGHDGALQLLQDRHGVVPDVTHGESHLVEGRQNLTPEKPLEYGKSITDACIGWEDSLTVLEVLAEAVAIGDTGYTPPDPGIRTAFAAFAERRFGWAIDRDRIHERVGGWENESDSQVVTEHIRRIRKKLAAAGAEPDPVETVWGMGYRWRA